MRIINFGSMNIDYVYGVDKFLTPGETKLAKSRGVYAGGKGLNQSIALARAGAEVYHAGIIGYEGQLLEDTLKSSGVRTDYIVSSDEAGGHTVIQVADSGQNSILLYGGTNRSLTKEFIDGILERFSSCDMVLLQNEINLPEYVIEKAFELGMTVAFNAAPADSNIHTCPIEKVSLLIVNEIEGNELTGEEHGNKIVNTLRDKYPDTSVLLTLGEGGCLFADKNREVLCCAYAVSDVVDTTGAGDTFIGYFLHSLTQGKSIEQSLELASMASALAIRKKGAAASIPWAKGVEDALDRVPFEKRKACQEA